MKNKSIGFWTSFFRDRWLIILCVILAFLAWQSIRKNIGNEITVSDVPVEIDVPEGWAVWENSLQRVNILFRGSRQDMLYLNNDQLRVIVPVDNPIADDEVRIKMTEKFLKNPTDSKVIRFNPPEIVVRLDQKTDKLLPVKATMEGSLPDGLEVDRIICTPASVAVSGAKNVLDDMISIQTDALQLKNRQSTFKESVPISYAGNSRIEIDPEWVSVEVILVERSTVLELRDIPVHLLSAPEDGRVISVTPTKVDLTIRGRSSRLEELTDKEILAYVQCMQLTEYAGYDLPVEVYLPTDLKLIKKEPAVIHVEVTKP